MLRPQNRPIQKKISMKRRTKSKKLSTAKVGSPEKERADKPGPQASPSIRKVETDAKPYTVQVAAFKTAGDADKLVAKLKQKGFAAYSKFDKIPNKGIWYRVRVGEFKSKAEAAGTLARLKKVGQKPILVKK